MLRERLSSIHKLIAQTGSIFVHLDWHSLHDVKVMLDRIFGRENFRNEIIVKRGRRKNLQYQFAKIDRMHSGYDSILWYSKSKNAKFTPPVANLHSDSKWMGFWSNTERPTMRYSIFGYKPERGQWKWSQQRAIDAIKNYERFQAQKNTNNPISLDEYWAKTGRKLEFIRKRAGVKYPEYWIPPKDHKILDNLWLDIQAYSYSTGYGTEKHLQLLERIISQFSIPGDLVADFFCGSGTTLVAAEKLGRKWIGCDSSAEAIRVARSRLLSSKFGFQQHTLVSSVTNPS
jgi:adenine-specific DNA-methyltransferase